MNDWENKKVFMNKCGICGSEQFVSVSYNYDSNHTIFASFSKIDGIISEVSLRPRLPSNLITFVAIRYMKMPIPSEALNFSLYLPGCFTTKTIDSCKGYKGFVTPKCFYVRKLTHKTGSHQAICNPWNRRCNSDLACLYFLNTSREKLIKLFFYYKKSLYILIKVFFHSWGFYSYRVMSKTDS